MEANLQHAVHVCEFLHSPGLTGFMVADHIVDKVMADYLREYAQGIEPN